MVSELVLHPVSFHPLELICSNIDARIQWSKCTNYTILFSFYRFSNCLYNIYLSVAERGVEECKVITDILDFIFYKNCLVQKLDANCRAARNIFLKMNYFAEY